MSKTKPLNRSVLITFSGDVTHAVKLSNYDDGSTALGATAKRSPDDKYSEYEGARVALARLYGVDPYPKEKADPLAKFKTDPLFKPLKAGEKVFWGTNNLKFRPNSKGFKTGDIVRVVNPMITCNYGMGDIGVVIGFSGDNLIVTFSSASRNRCVYPEEVKRIGHREEPKELFAALTEDYGIEPHLANAVINLLQEVGKHE